MKPFNTVGDIFLWFLGHFLKKAQEGIYLLSTFDWLISCVKFVISFLNIMLCVMFLYLTILFT